MKVAKYVIREIIITLKKWPYYALLTILCYILGSLIFVLSFGMIQRMDDVKDATFLNPNTLVRYYWEDVEFGNFIASYQNSNIQSKSFLYARDQVVASHSYASILRVAHVDANYLNLIDYSMQENQVFLKQGYLSKFRVSDRDMIQIEGKEFSVTVNPKVLDIEFQALITDCSDVSGIRSNQCIIEVKTPELRDKVRKEIETEYGSTAYNISENNTGSPHNFGFGYTYPDESDLHAQRRAASIITSYGVIALASLLYIVLQTISISKYYLVILKREWAIMRLYLGYSACFCKFLFETYIYSLIGALIAWFLIPLYFKYVGSGFYVPTYSLMTFLMITPVLLCYVCLVGIISFRDMRNESIAQHLYAKL